MKPSITKTIRDTGACVCWWVVFIILGCITHRDVSTIPFYSAIAVGIGLIIGMTGIPIAGPVMGTAILIFGMFARTRLYDDATALATLAAYAAGFCASFRWGVSLRRAIHRRRNATGQNPDSSGVEDGTTESSQFHQTQQAQ